MGVIVGGAPDGSIIILRSDGVAHSREVIPLEVVVLIEDLLENRRR